MIRLIDVTKRYDINGGKLVVLNNVNFDIRPGQRIGVLGRNGAGKSTLTRIVSGAEKPSTGTIERTMSVSWPLAFNGGFHGRLTGADNLRFICRIYGVDFRERLEFVKDFSELGKFLDEPVRIYSSGMKARLAFAISMVIDFDCFLIDEVIAVGDERFRERCRVELFEKRQDKAMLLVSHSRRYLEEVCNRFLLLNDGVIEEYPTFNDVLKEYKKLMAGASSEEA
ncbi:ABC transporter ATP-binding protein [Sphingomonas sp. RS6]